MAKKPLPAKKPFHCILLDLNEKEVGNLDTSAVSEKQAINQAFFRFAEKKGIKRGDRSFRPNYDQFKRNHRVRCTEVVGSEASEEPEKKPKESEEPKQLGLFEARLTEKLDLLVTSRYGDSPGPDVETMCKGQCEGLGQIPIHKDDPEEPFRSLWLKAEKKKPSRDGWHFVSCPDCDGTGLRK